jgi:hypothetical protein
LYELDARIEILEVDVLVSFDKTWGILRSADLRDLHVGEELEDSFALERALRLSGHGPAMVRP